MIRGIAASATTKRAGENGIDGHKTVVAFDIIILDAKIAAFLLLRPSHITILMTQRSFERSGVKPSPDWSSVHD